VLVAMLAAGTWAVLPAPAGAAAGSPRASSTMTVTLSRLLALARTGEVRTARIDSTTDLVTGTAVLHGRPRTYEAEFPVGFGPSLTGKLLADRVTVSAVTAGVEGSSGLAALLPIALMLLVAIAVFGVFRRRRSGGTGSGDRGMRSQSATNPAGFAKGHGEQVDVPATRFSDVAGIDEAVDSLNELVDYLKDPERYQAAGADLPRGYLLVGPPGTGKTLLARAVAGEAGAPFFAIGASEFVESYVGVGAARVRALFDRARAAKSAIVFVDELDAIGRSRSNHSVPGNEERESTLNQLLVELDGFASPSSVVVLAATNRPDILDAALLRPGRFDRQIMVPIPDRRGRSRILDLYLKRRSVAQDVDPAELGRRTAGFSGADLANLVNTAALLAVRAGTGQITNVELDEALATVALGPARKSAEVAERDRRITAWHEAGHALVGLWLEDAVDPISVSIVPRGQAGGVTWFPGLDELFLSRRQAKAQLAVAMAGRAAEELYLGDDFTQGAAQDFRAATDLARRMVTEYGMSSIGPGYVAPEETHIGVLAERVHDATGELLQEALATARGLLAGARPILEEVADRLIDEETLDTTALVALAGQRDPLAALVPLPRAAGHAEASGGARDPGLPEVSERQGAA
jgi:cell division protease FtsH